MIEIEYKKYQKLIMKLAWRFARTTNFEYDDLVGEGNLIFLECMPKYEPDKAAFSTYLTKCIILRFLQMIQNKKENNCIEFNETFCQSETAPIEKYIEFKDSINKHKKIKDDEQYLLNLALNPTSNFIRMMRQRAKSVVTRDAIQYYMQDYHGWALSRSWKTFKNIKRVLAEV